MSVPCGLLLACPEPYRNRAAWVFRQWALRYAVRIVRITRTGDLDPDMPLIVYGDATDVSVPHVHIPFAPGHADRAPTIETARWVDHEGEPVLDLWGEASLPLIARTGESVRLGMDVVSAVFHLLSGVSDDGVTDLDAHGRIPHDRSLVGRLGVTHRPVVEEWLRLISEAVECLTSRPVSRRDLWQGKPFALSITHDVDRVHRGWADALRRGGREALAGRFASARDISLLVARQALAGRDFYWNLDDLLTIAGRYDAAATFYLMASDAHPLDADYDLREERWRDVSRRIVEAGGEIGLHGSYRSYRDPDRLRQERERIEQVTGEPVVSVRQHFLRFDPRRTWQAQADAGLKYDSTIGFVEHVGFRAGSAFPYQPYDAEKDAPLPLVEVPLSIMDRTLEGYLKLSPERGWATVEPLLETVRAHGGCLTLLWHNIFVVDVCFPGWRRLYERILDWGRERGAWITSAANVAGQVDAALREG